MSMKTLKIALLFPTLLLAGCAENKFLSRPKDTNLEFWITERCTFDDLQAKGCTYLPGLFGGSVFLGSGYTPVEGSEGKLIAPTESVSYTLSGYPDVLDKGAITYISITDPKIYVYDLTIESSFKEIDAKMSKLKFKKAGVSFVMTTDGCFETHSYAKNNCKFSFSKHNIRISAATTNNQNVIF